MRTKLTLALAGAFAALALGSLAWAAIPDVGGVVHGCYDKASGALRITDAQTNVPKACTAKELKLDWSQQGPQGPAGPEGPQGPPGADAKSDAYLGNNTAGASTATGADCTLGEVLLTASYRFTAGGIPADGRLLPITQNLALFSLLGNVYGGDGKTTFALPDLRPITPNHMTYSICASGIYPG